MTSANDLLFSGGLPSVSFANAPIGTAFSFVIDKINEPRQQTDMASGNPQNWPDGRPKMTVPVNVTLKAGTFAPSSATDRGERSWWIGVGTQQHSALRDAVRQAGAQGIEERASVTVTLCGEEPSTVRGGNNKKLYAVEYTAPPSAGAAALAAAGAATFQPAPAASPVATPAPAAQTQMAGQADALAAAMANLTPEQRVALGLPNF